MQMNNNANQHIGIFDSGLGGLTVLKELKQKMPNEKFIYFGDTAHVPYGNKSSETIIKYVLKIIQFLKQKKIKLIIVACNTASSVALENIKDSTDIPVVDVISPSIRAACALTDVKTIGIIGTEATINSRSYYKKIKEHDKNIKIIDKTCSLFVPLIEEGLFNHNIASKIVQMYFDKNFCHQIDTLILGCTHYPMIKNTILNHIDSTIRIIDSAQITANYVKEYLTKLSIHNKTVHSTLYNEYYVSDQMARFNEIANMFLK